LIEFLFCLVSQMVWIHLHTSYKPPSEHRVPCSGTTPLTSGHQLHRFVRHRLISTIMYTMQHTMTGMEGLKEPEYARLGNGDSKQSQDIEISCSFVAVLVTRVKSLAQNRCQSHQRTCSTPQVTGPPMPLCPERNPKIETSWQGEGQMPHEAEATV
jgi:hypothetical protein